MTTRRRDRRLSHLSKLVQVFLVEMLASEPTYKRECDLQTQTGGTPAWSRDQLWPRFGVTRTGTSIHSAATPLAGFSAVCRSGDHSNVVGSTQHAPVTAGEPGKTIPPTVCTLAILASLGAPCQRSIHKVSARRTRGSSNGFLLWLGSMIPPQFQSLSCAVILSPSAPTSSSLTAGGSPRNSIAARSLRIASTRTACLST